MLPSPAPLSSSLITTPGAPGLWARTATIAPRTSSIERTSSLPYGVGTMTVRNRERTLSRTGSGTSEV
jgi:hypothetical protein